MWVSSLNGIGGQRPNIAPGYNPKFDNPAIVTAVDFFPTRCRLTNTSLPQGDFDGEAMNAV